jgi:hypothetical protein
MANPLPSKFTRDLFRGNAMEAMVAMRLAQKMGGAILPNAPGKDSTGDFRIGRWVSKQYEVKSHEAHARTGNLYYEVSCRGKDSGLRVTTSDWWVDVCPPTLVFISKPGLLLDWLEKTNDTMVSAGDGNASLGYLVSSKDLLKLAETAPEECYVLEMEA